MKVGNTSCFTLHSSHLAALITLTNDGLGSKNSFEESSQKQPRRIIAKTTSENHRKNNLEESSQEQPQRIIAKQRRRIVAETTSKNHHKNL
jgi:hypothetical protein